MNVVLEGPDGSGKSTLAAYIAGAVDMRVQQGSGPPKSRREIDDRMRSYLAMDGVIFDRHPCVSQPIYSALRRLRVQAGYAVSGVDDFDQTLAQSLYSTSPLVVYCRPKSAHDALDRHVVKEGEDPSHVAAVREYYSMLLNAYDQWALERAHLVYRIGDEQAAIADVVRVLAC